MNVMLPAKIGTRNSNSMAGSQVTVSKAVIRIAALPARYCVRVTGRDRYSCRARARRSSAISPEPAYTVMKNTNGSC